MIVLSREVFFNDFNGFGAFLAIFVKFHIVQKQVKDIPVTRICTNCSNTIFGFNFGDPRWASVRLKTFLVSELKQLLLDNLIIVLYIFNPREFIIAPSIIMSKLKKINLKNTTKVLQLSLEQCQDILFEEEIRWEPFDR